MKFRSLILLCAMLGATWFTYAADDSPTIETKVYPAVYKSKSGPTQRVWITINHSGKPASATLRLESQSQKVKLAEGENRFYFDVPVVNAPTKMHFAVSGAHSFSQDITVELLGGILVINVGEHVFMTGEAVTVFTGEVEI